MLKETTLPSPFYESGITETKTRHWHYKKRKLQTDILQEYRCKNPLENIKISYAYVYTLVYTYMCVCDEWTKDIMAWEDNGKKRGNGYSSFLSSWSILEKLFLQAGWFKISEVQDCPSDEKGALFDHKAWSQVASLAQGEIGISWMLYIVPVASF